MAGEIGVKVRVPLKDIPLDEFLQEKPPFDRLRLLHHLESITDEEFEEIREFVGDEEFTKFARRCKGFGNRVHDLSQAR